VQEALRLAEGLREPDADHLELALVDVRPHVRVVLGPGLDPGHPEVPADLADLILVPSRGGGHREEAGLRRARVVPAGDKDVRVVPDRPVALVHDEERDVPKCVPPGDEVVLHHLGCRNADRRVLPRGGTFVRGGLAGEHRGASRDPGEKPIEETVVLFDERFGRREEKDLPPLVIQAGCRDEDRDRGLPEAGREDDHGVLLERPHRDRELVLPGLEGVGCDEGMGDEFHQAVPGNLRLPSTRERTRSGTSADGTRTCFMLSRSRIVTVPSSFVS
jgi:hypothetical protein